MKPYTDVTTRLDQPTEKLSAPIADRSFLGALMGHMPTLNACLLVVNVLLLVAPLTNGQHVYYAALAFIIGAFLWYAFAPLDTE